MNNAEIQIQFARPGEWDDFSMTALWRDEDGYRHRRHHSPADVAASGHAGAMRAVVQALVGLAEPWQAAQVWARLRCEALPPAEGEADERVSVELEVEARRTDGGCKRLGPADYPEFRLFAAEALAFFTHFTTEH